MHFVHKIQLISDYDNICISFQVCFSFSSTETLMHFVTFDFLLCTNTFLFLSSLFYLVNMVYKV